jgi:hypothetical protein
VGGRADLHRLARDVHVAELLELVVHARQLAFDVLLGVRDALFDPRNVEKHPAVRAAPALLDLAHDATRDVIAGEQLRRAPSVFVALRVAPALLLVVRGLRLVVVRNEIEHEPLAGFVREDTALAAHAFGHEHAAHTRRPDHASGVELDVFHVDERGAGMIGQRVAVARAIPTVAGDLVGLPEAARGEHHGLGVVNPDLPALPIVGKRPYNAVAVLEHLGHANLHVHVDAAVDPAILERSKQLQPRAVANVRQAWIFVSAEIALEDAAIGRAIEDGAPGFQLAYTVGRLFRVQLGHAPVVDVLAAAHRVGEMDLPVVAVVHVGQRCRDAALRHDRVRLSKQALADHAD